MRVVGSDGTAFALTPLGYEFPGHRPEGVDDYDANWLLMRGVVEQPGGEAWTFESPCLTTWECESLTAWLDAVATGALDPVEFADTPDFDDPRLLTFTEPTIGFSLASRDGASAAVRVHLSLEALPPRLAEFGAVDIFEFFVLVQAGLSAWADASKALKNEVTPFPPR